MDFINWILMSSFEHLIYVFFFYAIFFDDRPKSKLWIAINYAVIILIPFLSYAIREGYKLWCPTTIQTMGIFLLFWKVHRIPARSAAVTVVISSQVYHLITSLVATLYLALEIVDPDEMKSSTYGNLINPLTVAVIVFLIAVALRIFKFRFSLKVLETIIKDKPWHFFVPMTLSIVVFEMAFAATAVIGNAKDWLMWIVALVPNLFLVYQMFKRRDYSIVTGDKLAEEIIKRYDNNDK